PYKRNQTLVSSFAWNYFECCFSSFLSIESSLASMASTRPLKLSSLVSIVLTRLLRLSLETPITASFSLSNSVEVADTVLLSDPNQNGQGPIVSNVTPCRMFVSHRDKGWVEEARNDSILCSLSSS